MRDRDAPEDPHVVSLTLKDVRALALKKAFWARIAAAPGAVPLRVGGHWVFEPSVNFYRQVAPAGPVLPFQRLANPDPMQFDYFVFNAVDFPGLDVSRLTVVAEEPGSGVMLVRPRGP